MSEIVCWHCDFTLSTFKIFFSSGSLLLELLVLGPRSVPEAETKQVEENHLDSGLSHAYDWNS